MWSRKLGEKPKLRSLSFTKSSWISFRKSASVGGEEASDQQRNTRDTKGKGKAKELDTSANVAQAPAAPVTVPSDVDGLLPEADLFKPPHFSDPAKKEIVERADDLGKGFVLLGVGGRAEDAWVYTLECEDEPTACTCCDYSKKAH
jgi:hypothetical protein